MYSLRIVSCNHETSLLKSKSWSSSEIAHRQLAALNKLVSVIAAFSLAVLANFSLLSSRFFNSCVLLLSNFVEKPVIWDHVKFAALALLKATRRHNHKRENQIFFIRKR